MAHIAVARGGEMDILFNLLEQAGGALTDDDDWVDGTTAGQWPQATIYTQGSSAVNVTAQVVKDITLDVIPDATHKHPVGTTGLWRRVTTPTQFPGHYALRVKPSTALALGDYDLEIIFDNNGAPIRKVHTIEIVEGGDIDFGATSVYVTASEVTSNFELADVVTSVEVDLARITADRMVNAYLEAEGIDFPRAANSPGWNALKTAAIAFARAELRRLKAVGTGMATGLRRITEADVTLDFVSSDSQFKLLHEEGAFWMDLAVKAILGSVYFSVGTIGRPAGGR